MEQKLSIITLGVKNMQIMRKFYEEQLSWKIEADNEHIVFYKLNGVLLALFSEESLAEDAGLEYSASNFKSTTFAQNYPTIEAVDAVFSELKMLDVTIIKYPEKAFWGGYRGYFSDPEGNLWEIAYNPFMTLDKHGNVMQHSNIN